MSVENAVGEMEALGHDWYVFRNENTKELSMIYCMFEGDYGIAVIK